MPMRSRARRDGDAAVKALTVMQPWAWAIVHGGKDVENRTQAWSYRGPLAIHAGARISERGMTDPLVTYGLGQTPDAVLHRGAIIGVVDLVDVHPSITCVDADGAMCSPWAEAAYDEHGGKTRRDIVHLVLEDPRPLAEPIKMRGALGLWTPPNDLHLEAVLRAQGVIR